MKFWTQAIVALDPAEFSKTRVLLPSKCGFYHEREVQLDHASSHQFNHYRRCHVCSSVTERSERIQRCDGCGKAIIPFFYFDESIESVPSADGLRDLPVLGLRPLWGLTAVWNHPGQD